MSDELNTNPASSNEPVYPQTVPASDPTPAFNYQAPNVEVPQAPTVDTQIPQQNPYQQPAQNYQAPQQNPYQQPAPNYQAPQQQSYTSGYYQYTPVDPNLVNAQNESDGFAIASGILGIVGLLTCCTFIPSILGLIFGIISKSKNDGTRPTTWSTIGIVCSVIGLVLGFIMSLLIVIGD